MRQARWRQHSWGHASSWGGTDYLVAVPDSVDGRGFLTMTPPVFRITVALHLCVPYHRLLGRDVACPCRDRCAALDPYLHVALSCQGAGHGPGGAAARHDAWSAVWRAFLDAMGFRMRHGRDLERWWPARDPPAKCPDHYGRGPDGTRWVALDERISHIAGGAARDAFGSAAAELRRIERAKRREYAGWSPDFLPERPRLVPLAASALGALAPSARRFFEASVRSFTSRRPASPGASASRGEVAALWRRRICTFLRVVVASAVHLRVEAAICPRSGSGGGSASAALAGALAYQQRCLDAGRPGDDGGGVLGGLGDGAVGRRAAGRPWAVLGGGG